MKPESTGVMVSSGSKDGELGSSSTCTSENNLSLTISLKSGSVKYGSEKSVWSTDRLAVSQVSITEIFMRKQSCGLVTYDRWDP